MGGAAAGVKAGRIRVRWGFSNLPQPRVTLISRLMLPGRAGGEPERRRRGARAEAEDRGGGAAVGRQVGRDDGPVQGRRRGRQVQKHRRCGRHLVQGQVLLGLRSDMTMAHARNNHGSLPSKSWLRLVPSCLGAHLCGEGAMRT